MEAEAGGSQVWDQPGIQNEMLPPPSHPEKEELGGLAAAAAERRGDVYEKYVLGRGWSSVVGQKPSICEALGLTSSTTYTHAQK
jgi:hypothetical protein